MILKQSSNAKFTFDPGDAKIIWHLLWPKARLVLNFVLPGKTVSELKHTLPDNRI